jgi:hypothetical protein
VSEVSNGGSAGRVVEQTADRINQERRALPKYTAPTMLAVASGSNAFAAVSPRHASVTPMRT